MRNNNGMKTKTKITIEKIENLEREIFGDVTIAPFVTPEIVAAIEADELNALRGCAL